MRYYYLYILLLLNACNQVKNKEAKTSNEFASNPLINSVSDSLADYILKEGIRSQHLLKITPDIKFSSGDSNGNISFYMYGFDYMDFNVNFVAMHKKNADERKIYINKREAKVFRRDNKEFEINSMNLQINYTESDVYFFRKNATYLVVVSYPMNWTGGMVRFSFIQLIDIKEKNVIEFIGAVSA